MVRDRGKERTHVLVEKGCVCMTDIQGLVNRNRMMIAIFAAFLTMLALMVLVRLPSFRKSEIGSVTIREKSGFYDLTDIENQEQNTNILPPGPTYYPNTLLTPETVGTAVTVSTEQYDALRADYLSQRFVVKLPDSRDVYILTFRLSGRHAMLVYVNGELVGQAGKPGTTKKDTEVQENNLTCYASPKDGEMDIILQSAQFYHFRSGAALATVSIRKAATAKVGGLTVQAKGFFVMGAFVCAALLLMCIFLLQSHTMATLYFALACLAMALRECIQSQAWTYFSFISGKVSFMLEYMSVVLLTIFLSMYLGQYIVGRFLHAVQCIAVIGSLGYGLCMIICDSIFYTSILKFYQVLLVLCIIPGIAGLIWNMRHPNKEQGAAIYGIAVFYLAAVSDILMYNKVFGYQYPKTPISEAAMLIFAIAQTASLFLMNNRVITQIREAEQKLAVEKKALEKLNRMKTEFLGNVSHELKTPLTVISSHIQHVQNSISELPEFDEAKRSMKLVDSEAVRMAMMVSQLLDISRIDEGHMVIDRKRESIVEIIQVMLDNYYPVFSKNHNTLTFKKEGYIPSVYCDRNRITQVLVNLITNASRHTREGKITVSVKAEGSAVEVAVSDNGEGIAADRIPYLFDRYYSQTTETEKASFSGNTGTGLGLYICKHIVQAHGGSINAESQQGEGTKVYFTLPEANAFIHEP